jgi:hypothetical protein
MRQSPSGLGASNLSAPVKPWVLKWFDRQKMLLKSSEFSRIWNMPHALPVIIVRRVDRESYVVGHDSCASQRLYDHGMTVVAVFFLFSFLSFLM